MHGYKTICSIDHTVKNIIQMGPNFTWTKSVENAACVGQKPNKIRQNKVPNELNWQEQKCSPGGIHCQRGRRQDVAVNTVECMLFYPT